MTGDIDVPCLGRNRFDVTAAGRQGAKCRRAIDYDSRDRGTVRGTECAGADVDNGAGRDIAKDVRAHLPSEFLTDDAELRALQTLNIHHVGQERGVHADGKAGADVDAEMRMGEQDDGGCRQYHRQRLADEFRVGIDQRLMADFPDFRKRWREANRRRRRGRDRSR